MRTVNSKLTSGAYSGDREQRMEPVTGGLVSTSDVHDPSRRQAAGRSDTAGGRSSCVLRRAGVAHELTGDLQLNAMTVMDQALQDPIRRHGLANGYMMPPIWGD